MSAVSPIRHPDAPSQIIFAWSRAPSEWIRRYPAATAPKPKSARPPPQKAQPTPPSQSTTSSNHSPATLLNCISADRFRLAKRPLPQMPRPRQIYQNTRSHRRKRGQHRLPPRREKNPQPAKNRNYYRQRVEPHPKWHSVHSPTSPQNHQPHRLADKLDEAAHRQDGANHVNQAQPQAKHKCRAAQRQQRNMRKPLRRMDPRKRRKEISVQRCSVRDARIPQHRRKD